MKSVCEDRDRSLYGRSKTRSVERAVQRQRMGVNENVGRGVRLVCRIPKIAMAAFDPVHRVSDAKMIFEERTAQRVSEGGGEA